jgi:putative endonuclease
MPENRRASAGGYTLYILRCADGSLYTGIATDLDARLAEHADGRRGAKYLRGRSPFELVYSAPAGDRGEAQSLEYRVKKLRRADKLALIEGRRAAPALRS